MAKPFPVDNATTPFWLSEADELATHRTTVDLPDVTDVVIIGSGFAGASTAYHLLKNRGKQTSVVILEARETCSGATARNGGHFRPSVYGMLASHEALFGTETAIQLASYEVNQLRDIKKLIEEENIDCDFQETNCTYTSTDETNLNQAQETYQNLVSRGKFNLDDIEVTFNPEEAKRRSGIEGAVSSITHTSASLWPYKLATHLLRRALTWGANLQTLTPATSLTPLPSGTWQITTPRGSITTPTVILATNAHTAALLPEFAGKIVPVRGTAAHISTTGSGPSPPLLRSTYGIAAPHGNFDYLIQRRDGSVIVGGAKALVLADDSLWRDNVDDAHEIAGVRAYYADFMQRTFVGWEGAATAVESVWTGVMGYADDLLPYVGAVPGREGVFVNAGFTGHGMPRILGCAAAVAAVVRGEVSGVGEAGVPGPYVCWAERMARGENRVDEYMKGSYKVGEKDMGAVE